MGEALIFVLVESPFAGNVKRNEAYVRAAMRDCLLRGESPFASHAIYTLPGVLDDDVPEERSIGIEAGLVIGAFASKTVVYHDFGISSGMAYGIESAKKCSRPIEYRSLKEFKYA